MAASHSQNTW